MTEKQVDTLVTKPATQKAIAVLQKFAGMEAQYKELEKQKKEAEAQILEAMETHGVQKISGDWGYITLATRTSYSEDGKVAPRFTKKVLDSTKVKAHHILTGELPEGVVAKETKYLTKRIK